jgi:glycosyltransferase involved in cell wall biosynthesis
MYDYDDQLKAGQASSRFRILHLASSERWTGEADPAISLAHGQRRLGHSVWLACVAGRSFEEKARERDIDVLNSLHLNRRLNPFHFVSDLRTLRTFLRQQMINIIHCHLYHDHWLAAIATRKITHPHLLVRTLHRPKLPYSDPLHRMLFARKTDLTITVYQGAKASVSQTLRLPAEKVVAIYGGVDLEWFHPTKDGNELRKSLAIPPTAPIVGIVARIRADRGHQWLFRTIPHVLEKLPHVYFLIVGKGEMKKPLEEQLQNSPFRKQVIMAGYRSDDLPECYAAMNVSLFLGLGTDGTCRAVLEAMASGRPVVGVNKGAMPETVEHGKSGFLVNQGDVRGLAQALITVCENRGLAAQMGRRGREIAETRFAEQRRAEETLAAYAKAWQMKHGSPF